MFVKRYVAAVLSLHSWHAVAQPVVQPAPRPAAQPASQPLAWKFEVLLDDKPIGHHDFALKEDGPQRELRSDARFDVKLLFISAYRYRHHASETWNGNCLAKLSASTDDNGALSSVEASSDDRRLLVRNDTGNNAHEGCVMSFAYWNPAILRQPRLLNPQTGLLETVNVRQLPDTHVVVGQRAVPARHYKISGPANPIELWYAADGDWLQLASTVKGGMKLIYRRKE